MASQDRFGYEWAKYSEILPAYEEQFLRWIYPIDKHFFRGKTVLDAGCGMGRNAYWALQYGAEKVVAFDDDEKSLAAARKTLSEFQGARVDRGNIETFKAPERFDLVFSIGVIHHLENPAKALANLMSLVKPDGRLLIWVYGYEGNEWIVKFINPLRTALTSRLPIGATHFIAHFFSIPLYLYVKLFPQRRPYLNLLRKFSFRHIHSIVFDQLLPTVANYWKREEVERLLSALPDVDQVELHPVNGMSWTGIARRRSS